ncbi:IclR family transcriptional regulator [Actinoplanes sp. TRM 88003]|uniref:IclR family transcriptional regulator n=1 Tax=Paractinoplanes aksuensis TaxID=2939490 RepID=A0ABT1E3D1_9ACTN|nr:IclR family transcriptional regulator [Actinoplanes aksuensis]MCO8277515.1 IclR family transcriptional regulator [Actinoplanes aksuensis]
MPNSHPPSVLGKAKLLLSAFDGNRPTLGLTDLSRRSGIPKATAYRLAQELVELSLLDRVADGYQLGWRMFELGQLVPGPANLRRLARPALLDLHSVTKAAVHLAVRDGHDSLLLERLAGRRDTRMSTAAGMRMPIWFSASGKLFLAHSPEAEHTMSLLDQGQVTPRTRHSVKTSKQLRAQVASIRDRSWAEEHEECVEGYRTYAVPITLGGPLQVVAAVSVTLDVSRRDDQQAVRALWAVGADISRTLQSSLGHVPPVGVRLAS